MLSDMHGLCVYYEAPVERSAVAWLFCELLKLKFDPLLELPFELLLVLVEPVLELALV